MKVFELLENDDWDNSPQPEGNSETRLNAIAQRIDALDLELAFAHRKVRQWVKDEVLQLGMKDEGGTWLRMNFPTNFAYEWRKTGLYYHLNPNGEKSHRFFQYLQKYQEKVQNIVNQKMLLDRKYDKVRRSII